MLLLFQMHVKVCEEKKEFVFVQYMDVTHPRHNVDSALGCVGLRCSIDDDIGLA